jgi:hypothetical protein
MSLIPMNAKPWPAGGIGPGRPGHALTLTRFAHMIKAGALPSRRVSHADQRYYDPLGLPLPSKGVE